MLMNHQFVLGLERPTNESDYEKTIVFSSFQMIKIGASKLVHAPENSIQESLPLSL